MSPKINNQIKILCFKGFFTPVHFSCVQYFLTREPIVCLLSNISQTLTCATEANNIDNLITSVKGQIVLADQYMGSVPPLSSFHPYFFLSGHSSFNHRSASLIHVL